MIVSFLIITLLLQETFPHRFLCPGGRFVKVELHGQNVFLNNVKLRSKKMA